MIGIVAPASAQSLVLPASTAYIVGSTKGAHRLQNGNIEWSSPDAQLEWGGFIATPGRLHLQIRTQSSAKSSNHFRIDVDGRHLASRSNGLDYDFPEITIAHVGWQIFRVRGLSDSRESLGEIKLLRLDGTAVKSARFNLKERLNSASVHLFYPTKDQAEWFYNEVIPLRDPISTYYMACGFKRGYFGMQVNGPSERRIIFSVWDSGKETADRSKVAAEDRVELLAKGSDVFAADFGNEGTGGHSHMLFPWKLGVPARFLVHAEPKGERTVYTGYFWSPSAPTWKLIAAFSAPHDCEGLQGLYSFVEDFDGKSGFVERKALFGPAWTWSATKGWQPLKTARFSHDLTGGKDRWDYDCGVLQGRFYLQNGAFTGSTPKSGATITLPNTPSKPPSVDLARLVQQSAH